MTFIAYILVTIFLIYSVYNFIRGVYSFILMLIYREVE